MLYYIDIENMCDVLIMQYYIEMYVWCFNDAILYRYTESCVHVLFKQYYKHLCREPSDLFIM